MEQTDTEYKCEPTMVVTNHARVDTIRAKRIYVYTVEITNADAPDEQLKDTATRIELFAKAVNQSSLVFDGREYAYTAHKLSNWTTASVHSTSASFAHTAFHVALHMHRTYDTKLLFKDRRQVKEAAETDERELNARGIEFALDSIIRSAGMHTETLEQHEGDKATGFSVHWEHRASVRVLRSGVYVAINARARPITNVKTVADLARAFFRTTPGPSSAWTRFDASVRGLRVCIGSEHVVLNGLTSRAHRDLKINGSTINEHYKCTSLDTDWPCAVIAHSNTPVPLELCTMEPQLLPRISGWQRMKLMAQSVLTPTQRQRMLERAVQHITRVCAEDPGISDFGIVVSPELARVQGHVLPRPCISFGSSTFAQLDPQASWTIGQNTLYKAAHISKWAIAVFCSKQQCPESQLLAFSKQLIKTAHELGLDFDESRPQIIYAQTPRVLDTLSTVRDAQIIICVVPSTSVSLYGEIKRVAYTQLGIHTQCVNVRNTKGSRSKLVEALVLKINTKLGGQSTNSFEPTEPTMYISADVCHTTEINVSVASFVWSVDSGQKFAGTVVQHPKRQEIIENMDVLTRHALRVHYKHTRVKPVQIVYLRDGVSDSQLEDVRRIELDGIIRGCKLVDPKYEPRVLLMIARKRHCTRFVQETSNFENCVPGTVVTEMTRNGGFHLIAHHAIHGVSKPTYFLITHNTTRMSNADIHKMTYDLCFAYPIVMRAVTMPAPLYYAHRLSGKGRVQTNEPFDLLPYFNTVKKNAKAKHTDVYLVPVHQNLAHSMYFM
ncbi:hypothetical protein GGF49_002350 [Coemansia sp. RSA 1853]|nr:hypothetical protein LPJ76_004106 [Coemansia sp. RSA 638]KAJ2543103.1 hypothetical protein GGF49_002350 [Coemansia sp. RSA 1853]